MILYSIGKALTSIFSRPQKKLWKINDSHSSKSRFFDTKSNRLTRFSPPMAYIFPIRYAYGTILSNHVLSENPLHIFHIQAADHFHCHGYGRLNIWFRTEVIMAVHVSGRNSQHQNRNRLTRRRRAGVRWYRSREWDKSNWARQKWRAHKNCR